MQIVTRKVRLSHDDTSTLKLYVNLKDRTEKDSIDPLSSLTSALTKMAKSDIGGLVIDFEPLSDTVWRTPSQKVILASHMIPHVAKPFLLHSWPYISWIFFPITIFLKLFQLLSRDPHTEEQMVDKKHDEKSGKEEAKTDAYGYSVNIVILKNARDDMSDALILNEIGSSLNIYANPSGNQFKIKKIRKMRYIDIHRHV